MQPVAATVGMRRRLCAATFRRLYFAGVPARRGKIKGNIMSAVTLRATRRGPLIGEHTKEVLEQLNNLERKPSRHA